MYNVQNKTVLITGAAAGIGYKCAEILLRNGAKSVAVVDLPTSNGQNAAATLENEFGKGRALFVACDVTKVEDLKKTFEKIIDAFDGLDILINNAGTVNDKLWEQTINLNVNALIRSSMLAMDYMGKHKGGKGGVIVNVASVLALEPAFHMPMYCATKHAVLGFSQALAGLHDKTGVRVLIMCPGSTTTALLAKVTDEIQDLIQDMIITIYDPGNITSEIEKYPKQTTDNLALAMLGLIQKGKNGATWVSEGGQPPYAVDFPHYSKRSLPV